MGEGGFSSTNEDNPRKRSEVGDTFQLLNDLEENGPDADKLNEVESYLADSISKRSEADSYDETILKKALGLDLDGNEEFIATYRQIERMAFEYVDDVQPGDLDYFDPEEDYDF